MSRETGKEAPDLISPKLDRHKIQWETWRRQKNFRGAVEPLNLLRVVVDLGNREEKRHK